MPRQNTSSNKVTISAVIITLNEEKNIKRCLNSLKWTDEIIVIDSGSTDKTCDIAKKMGVKVFHNPWPGYGMQKCFGIEKTTHPWVIVIDADEEVTQELAKNIKSAIKSASENSCYKLKRSAYFLGKKIKHGDWGRDWVIRVFPKATFNWSKDPVHEGLLAYKNEAFDLTGELLHHTQDSIHQALNKINHYSTLSADMLIKKGKKSNLLKAILKSKWTFFRAYIIRLGFLDGKVGYVIAKNAEIHTYYKQLKLVYKNK